MKITVEIPDHLAGQFLDWMSNSGEQEFMEQASEYFDVDTLTYVQNPNHVVFDYPGYTDQIVITEVPKD